MAVDQSWIANLLQGFRSLQIDGTPVDVGQTDAAGNPIIYNILNLISGANVVANPNNTPPTLDVTLTGSGSGISALTGDGAASGTGSVPFTLATVNANTGTWGDATDAVVLTVDGKGRITAISSTPILPNLALATGVLGVTHGGTGLATMTANGVMIGEGTASPNFVGLTSGQLLIGQASGDPAAHAVSGDATLSAAGAFTLSASGVTAATYGDASDVPVIVVDAKGRITSATTSAITAPLGTATGTLAIGQLGHGTAAQLLVTNAGATAPAWVTASGDATLAASGALTLATVASAGTTGGGNAIPVITINAKGLVTSITTTAVTPTSANLPTITLTGDTTGAASGGSIATTAKSLTGNAGTVAVASTGNTIQWATGATGPTLTQTAAVSGAGANMTLAPQAATTTGASGSLIVNFAAPASGTTEGALEIERGGTLIATLQGLVGNATTFFALYPGGVVPAGGNYAFAARVDGTQTYFGASSALNFQCATFNFNNTAGSNFRTASASAAFTDVFSNSVTSVATSHTALASTSAGSGAVGSTMSVTAQAGQAATGASNIGGSGGTALIKGGAGGSSGSAQGGAGGQVQITGGAAGAGTTGNQGGGVSITGGAGTGTGLSGGVALNNIFQFGGATGALNPTQLNTIISTGTVTISSANCAANAVLLFSGTQTGALTIDLSNGVSGLYWLDFSQVTSLGSFAVSVKNGTTTTAVTSLFTNGKTLLTVNMQAINKLSVG